LKGDKLGERTIGRRVLVVVVVVVVFVLHCCWNDLVTKDYQEAARRGFDVKVERRRGRWKGKG